MSQMNQLLWVDVVATFSQKRAYKKHEVLLLLKWDHTSTTIMVFDGGGVGHPSCFR